MIDETIEKLTHKDPHTRYQALKVLSARGEAELPEDVVARVTRVCREDKLPYNRLEAMNVLRWFWGAEGVADAFRERLEDEPYIVEAAVALLGAIGRSGALELLEQVYRNHPDVHIRLQVIRSLRGADQEALFGFLKASRAHESSDDRIRATVVAVLAEVRNPTLKSVFLKALGDENARVRANALEALAAICERKELFQVLARFAKDRSNRVRANAIKGLLDLGVRQAEGLLHEMAHHQNPRYRSSAAWVLGEVGHRVTHGRAWLEHLAADRDSNVTYRAEKASKRYQRSVARAA